ncbi:MAG: DegT/DnrJ/EryC1/StrS family aminotransferase [Anaerolineae bacterium]
MVIRLAIDGGVPVRTRPWPVWPVWDEAELAALTETLQSGAWWAPPGTQVQALEREFAAYHEARFAVACTNGSAALEIALRAAGVDWGDEIITTPYTFIATASACLLVGAIPRFADVLQGTWNIDPAAVEDLITSRTRAILPVHIAGEPADMDALRTIAARHQLVLIEDAAQAHGATWQGHKVGALGDMGTFSFQASKNMNAGEGGMVITNDPDLAERCWSVVNVGRQREGAFYQHVGLSSNYRMAEWMGAVLRSQLARLEEQSERRSASAAHLFEALSEVSGLTPVRGDPRVTRSAHHLVRLWYDPAAFGGKSRAEFIQAMNAEGIPLREGYPVPLSRQDVVVRRTAYIRDRLDLPAEPPDDCPVCEQVCEHGLWLAQSVLLGEREDMDDIAEAARRVQDAWADRK